MDDLARDAELVIIGRVVAAAYGEPYGAEAAPQRDRLLSIRVERTILGDERQEVTFRALGQRFVDGDWLEMRDAEDVHLTVGQRVFAAVTTDGALASPLNGQSTYVFDGGEVADTERSDAFVREMESLSEREFVARVEAARDRRTGSK